MNDGVSEDDRLRLYIRDRVMSKIEDTGLMNSDGLLIDKNIEPATITGVSQAISLKRIADALEFLAKEQQSGRLGKLI